MPQRPSTRLLRRALAPAALLSLVTAAALGGPAPAASAVDAAGAAPARADAGSAGLARTLVRVGTRDFPAARPAGSFSGVQDHEVPTEPETSLTHEHSPRPTADSLAVTEAATGLRVPDVPSSPVAGVTQGLVTSFQGLDAYDQRYANGGNQFSVEPPDQALCVGNGYTVEATNDVLRVYRASGAPATPVTDLNTFFGYPAQYDRTTGVQGPFVTDPVCLFDAATSRFFVVVLTLDVDPDTGGYTGRNTLDVAVSRTADPTRGYHVYRLPVQDDGTQGTPRHRSCPCIGDYPHIGADAHGLYLTTNEYPFEGPGVYGNGFNGAQVYALSKQQLAQGRDRVRVKQFEHTALPSGSGSVPGFTVWPATSPARDFDTRDGGTEHLLSSTASRDETQGTGLSDRLGVYALTRTSDLGTGGPGPYLSRALRPSQVYGVPPLVEQKAGPTPLRDCIVTTCLEGVGPDNEVEGPLDASDSRMQQVWYAAGHVWGALTTVVRVEGQAKAGIAWFVLDPGTAPSRASVARQGYLALARNNVTFPAIATLPDGRGAIALNVVGQDHYPSAAFARIDLRSTGPISFAAHGVGPQDGFSEYNAFAGEGNPPRPRWGDYSAAGTDGSTVWTASEYVGQSCRLPEFTRDPTCGGERGALVNWATRISRVTP